MDGEGKEREWKESKWRGGREERKRKSGYEGASMHLSVRRRVKAPHKNSYSSLLKKVSHPSQGGQLIIPGSHDPGVTCGNTLS